MQANQQSQELADVSEGCSNQSQAVPAWGDLYLGRDGKEVGPDFRISPVTAHMLCGSLCPLQPW